MTLFIIFQRLYLSTNLCKRYGVRQSPSWQNTEIKHLQYSQIGTYYFFSSRLSFRAKLCSSKYSNISSFHSYGSASRSLKISRFVASEHLHSFIGVLLEAQKYDLFWKPIWPISFFQIRMFTAEGISGRSRAEYYLYLLVRIIQL